MSQTNGQEKNRQTQGHRERVRRRFLDSGLDGFREDYEVLELLLQFAIPYRDTKQQAKLSAVKLVNFIQRLTTLPKISHGLKKYPHYQNSIINGSMLYLMTRVFTVNPQISL